MPHALPPSPPQAGTHGWSRGQGEMRHLGGSSTTCRLRNSMRAAFLRTDWLSDLHCFGVFLPTLLILQDRCFAVGLDGGGIKLYDMRNFNAFHTIHGNRELKISSPPVSQLKFSNDGNWIAASVQEFIYVYDIKPGGKMDAEKPTYTFKTGSAGKQEFCFTPNDKYLLRCASRTSPPPPVSLLRILAPFAALPCAGD